MDPAETAVARLLGDLQAQLQQIQQCADSLATLIARGTSDERLGELRACAVRASDLARELTHVRYTLAGRRPRDLNDAIRSIAPTLATVAAVRFDLRLADEPVLVAAHQGELERILVNLILNTSETVLAAGSLTITTAMVTNPSSGGTSLPRGRYARLDVAAAPTGAGPRDSPSRNAASWAVGQLEGRVALESDATGGTTLSVLLPLMAEL